MCFRTGQALRREENKDKVLEGKFRNLNVSPSTKKTTEFSFELFLSIYRYWLFFLKFLTSILSNSFSKAIVDMRFPAKKKAGCPKAPCDFPPRKDDILHPPSGYLGTSLHSSRVCTDGRSTYLRAYADVPPKFLASIGYQIFLSMVLLSVLLRLNKRFMTYAAYLTFKRP